MKVRLAEHGLLAEAVERLGDPASEILTLARELGIDVIGAAPRAAARELRLPWFALTRARGHPRYPEALPPPWRPLMLSCLALSLAASLDAAPPKRELA